MNISENNALIINGRQLPENLSVLFVDDDWKLRTLFSRALGRATNGWTIREASNGETALRLTEDQEFDVIIIEQYMSSVVKQLLGTETVQALRARGVVSAICGLSENDTEKPFLGSGANMFFMKPLPTDKQELTQLLFRILDSTGNHRRGKAGITRNPMPKSVSTRSIASSNTMKSSQHSAATEYSTMKNALPVNLSVLVVDDDDNLRQLYVRSLKRAVPTWTVAEVSSGEAALEYVDEKQAPEVIFVDQYMPNPHSEKPLLGTETVYALRAKGVTSIICGLSANDMASAFLESGSDCFHMKPFPCEKDEMIRELTKILGVADALTESETSDTSFSIGRQRLSQPSPGRPQQSQVEQTHSTQQSRLSSPKSQLQNGGTPKSNGCDTGLPENLKILYAEDSPSLRKMFARSILRVTKGWVIHEVECGEEALSACDDNTFDMVFLDQHQKTDMLGTEIARALRDRGVTSIICGLSGDDIESKFIMEGADTFSMKPFPCEKGQLTAELHRILKSRPRPAQ